MNIKLNPVRRVQTAIFIFLLTFMVVSAISTSATNDPPSHEGVRRAEMMKIAERYWSYIWTATSNNIWHTNDGIHDDNKTDTPNIGYCNDPWGCWDIDPVTMHISFLAIQEADYLWEISEGSLSTSGSNGRLAG